MIRSDLSTTGILDAAVPHLRRVAAPAAGVLLLTALPVRLLEIHFIDLVHRLGGDAVHYGNLLTVISALSVVAFVASLYGRAVFMRACHEMPQSWRSLLRLNAKSFLAYVYVALMLELSLVLLGSTIIVIPLLVMLAGVAAAASTDPPQIGLVRPLRALAPYLQHGRVLAGLMFVFGIAYVIVAINLTILASVLVWAADAIPGFDSVNWQAALHGSFRYKLSIYAAAATVLEPFFLAAMHVFADRVRSRQSGEDLIRRFRALIRQKALAAAVLALALIPGLLHAEQRTISASDYVAGLRNIRNGLAAGRYGEATTVARDLGSVGFVMSARSRFEPDRALLRAADESAARAKPDVSVIERLTATIEALGGAAVAAHNEPADRGLLDRIRIREKAGELMRGGELKNLPQTSPTLSDELARIFHRVIDWLAVKLEGLFDWIAKLWPKARSEDEDEQAFLGVPVVVWVVTSLIVATMLLLAAYVLRRSKRRAAIVQSDEAAASHRDADPLSRESNEWERYAAELAANGRLREAIRAWYHAVLVTLYRAGILHYRKGVTNWEYIAVLSPAVAWRPQFVSMTKKFDREWYGHRETTADVLDSCAADAHTILEYLRQGSR